MEPEVSPRNEVLTAESGEDSGTRLLGFAFLGTSSAARAVKPTVSYRRGRGHVTDVWSAGRAREHAELFGPGPRALRARACRGRGMWAGPPARAAGGGGTERSGGRGRGRDGAGWRAGAGSSPERLGRRWQRRETGDPRLGASAMTAELQQDDAAGAADGHSSVGSAAASGSWGRAPGPEGSVRGLRGCGLRRAPRPGGTGGAPASVGKKAEGSAGLGPRRLRTAFLRPWAS